MKTFLVVVGVLVALAIALVLGHLAFIELGRDVVTLRTQNEDGSWNKTRLWVVGYDGASWLHSKGADWVARFEGSPVVELERNGQIARYTATAEPGAHAEIDRALREKYGLADRWVRFLAPCDESVVPVRLERLPAG